MENEDDRPDDFPIGASTASGMAPGGEDGAATPGNKGCDPQLDRSATAGDWETADRSGPADAGILDPYKHLSLMLGWRVLVLQARDRRQRG
jgi:hypothetical protein